MSTIQSAATESLSMPLEQELNNLLKERMKARDGEAVGVIRMIKSRIMEQKKSPDFSGDVTDELVIKVIATYVKQMKKALQEYERMGENGNQQAAGLKFEIAFLEPFLPKKLDEAATRDLVAAAAARESISDPKQMGRLIGAVMKTHRDQVEPALVRQLAQQLLSGT